MTVRTAILSGAAASVLAATAALAQSDQNAAARYGSGPQESTPAERAQTEQLNEQAVNGTTQSPAVLNGEAQNQQGNPRFAQESTGAQSFVYGSTQGSEYGQAPGQNSYGQDGRADGPPQELNRQDSPRFAQGYAAPQSSGYGSTQGGDYGPPAAVQNGYGQGGSAYGPPPDRDQGYRSPGPQSASDAQYQDQLRQYQAQMERYRDEHENYRAARGAYLQNLRDYDLAQYAWDYPAPVAYHYGPGYGLQPLYLLAEPSEQLARAPVEGPGGTWVGRVRNVEIAPDGRPWRVEVALNRRVSVWVNPGDFRFDPEERVLYTDLSRDRLWEMPGATVESGPF